MGISLVQVQMRIKGILISNFLFLVFLAMEMNKLNGSSFGQGDNEFLSVLKVFDENYLLISLIFQHVFACFCYFQFSRSVFWQTHLDLNIELREISWNFVAQGLLEGFSGKRVF